MSAGADSSSTSMRLSEKHQKALLKKQRYEFLLGPFPVQLSKTKTKGRHLLASQDLDPGTLILQEFPVGWSFFKNAIETHCAFCLKEIQEDRKSGHTASDFGMNGLNLSPSSPSDPSSIVQADKAPKWCSKCRKQTRYCSSKCLDLDLQRHALECKLVTELPGIAGAHSTDYSLLRLILRFLSNRVHKETFQSDFDQDCKENEFLPSWNAFMATKDLVGSPTALANTKWLNCIQNAAQDIVENDPDNILRTTAEEIIKLACQINANSFALYDPESQTQSELGVSLLPLCGLLNHSCSPNCVATTGPNGQSQIRTVSKVEKGQELTISYIDLYLPTYDRRGHLLETKSFWCQCSRCAPANEGTDWELEGLVCTSADCGQEYLKPQWSSTEEQPTCYSCTICGFSISREEFMELQQHYTSDYEAALDFFKAGDIRCALDALKRFESTTKAIKLHPSHKLLFNLQTSLLNCSLRVQDYKTALKAVQTMLQQWEIAEWVPDYWPEKSDYFYKFGELLEIYLEAVEEGLLTREEGEELGVMTRSGEYVVTPIEAYIYCWEIRKIAFGEAHPSAVLAKESVDRLRN